ncbi:conjugal transfer protein TraG N-terminal domain-containing protein [Rickettsiales endosymbiont of Trichoplax sp. H2]|uniref:conjugal transfer protein TraG N-terminal domain-containing protein n=1 Tax=Rickettsiales endosymbiont of Trichoplax sp. H2 TaxID=2021221 RepID=UPI0012B28EA5|nr:conjugal transfer protein TraG N-terminal domain-containing protein [Rickettsiales endosymbiont of Trichoplax sp. H2]MSO14439.1 Protein TraG [Rickettsiales endosymbiont of Trichoplax sp. H2]
MNEIYEIITHGGGPAMVKIFDAIAMTNKDETFKAILYIASLYAGLWVIFIAFSKSSGAILFKHLMWVWVVTSILWASTVRVKVTDPVNGMTHDVDNVPLLVGYFGSRINSIGYGVTKLIENNMTDLDSTRKYRNSGMAFGSKAVAQISNMKISNADLYQNVESYINNCVVMDAAIGTKYTYEDIRTSDNIFDLVFTDGHPIFGIYYRPFEIREKGTPPKDVEYKSCKDAGPLIMKDFETYFGSGNVKNVAIKIAKGMGLNNFVEISDKDSSQRLKAEDFFMKVFSATMVSKAGDNFIPIKENATEVLRQAMMIHAINDATKSAAEAMGSPQNYASAKAMLQQRNWYNAIGENVATMLVTAKVIFEILIYGSILFIGILAILPNGVMIVLNYLSLILWLELWQPLYALLNCAITVYSDYRTDAILAGTGGFNINSFVGIGSFHADIAATAGYFSLSVPFLAYGLLTLMRGGAASLMHAATGMTGGLSSSAGQAAAESTSGSMSIGALNYDTSSLSNSTRWQSNEDFRHMAGRTEIENPDGTISFVNTDGGTGFIGGKGRTASTFEKSISSSNAIGSQLNANISAEKSKSDTFAHEYSQAESSLVGKGTKFLESAYKNLGRNDSWGMSTTTDSGKALQGSVNFMKGIMKEFGLSEQDASGFALSLGMPGIGGINFSSSAGTQEMQQKVKKYADEHGYTESLHKLFKNTADSVYSEAGGEGLNLAKDVSSSHQNMTTAKDSLSRSQQSLSRYQQAQNLFESGSFVTNEDLTQRVYNKLANTKVSGGEGGIGSGRDFPSHSHIRYMMSTGSPGYITAVKKVQNEVVGELLSGVNSQGAINNQGNVFNDDTLNKTSSNASANTGLPVDTSNKNQWDNFRDDNKNQDQNIFDKKTVKVPNETGGSDTKVITLTPENIYKDESEQSVTNAQNKGVTISENEKDAKKKYQNVKVTDESGKETTVNLIDQSIKKDEERSGNINKGVTGITSNLDTMNQEHNEASDKSNIGRANNRMAHDNFPGKYKSSDINIDPKINNQVVNQNEQQNIQDAKGVNLGQNPKSKVVSDNAKPEGAEQKVNQVTSQLSSNYTVKAKEIVLPDEQKTNEESRSMNIESDTVPETKDSQNTSNEIIKSSEISSSTNPSATQQNQDHDLNQQGNADTVKPNEIQQSISQEPSSGISNKSTISDIAKDDLVLQGISKNPSAGDNKQSNYTPSSLSNDDELSLEDIDEYNKGEKK